MRQPSHKTALLLMIIAPTMWSTAGVLSRQLESARGFEVSFWRSFFAALFVGYGFGLAAQSRAWAEAEKP